MNDRRCYNPLTGSTPIGNSSRLTDDGFKNDQRRQLQGLATATAPRTTPPTTLISTPAPSLTDGNSSKKDQQQLKHQPTTAPTPTDVSSDRPNDQHHPTPKASTPPDDDSLTPTTPTPTDAESSSTDQRQQLQHRIDGNGFKNDRR
jgi:hypothetical protein